MSYYSCPFPKYVSCPLKQPWIGFEDGENVSSRKSKRCMYVVQFVCCCCRRRRRRRRCRCFGKYPRSGVIGTGFDSYIIKKCQSQIWLLKGREKDLYKFWIGFAFSLFLSPTDVPPPLLNSTTPYTQSYDNKNETCPSL